MRIRPIRPTGVRVHPGSNIKIKGLMQVHKSTDGNDGWTKMWTTTHDWDGWLRPGLDAIKATNCNLAKIVAPNEQLLDANLRFPSQAVDNMRQWLDYCRTIGLYATIQMGLNAAGTLTQHVAAAKEIAKILTDYPHVPLFNLQGELGWVFGTSTEYVAAASSEIRQFSNLPLTVSFDHTYWPPPATSAYFDALAPHLDLWEFDPYEDTFPVPTIEQARAFRNTSYFKPFLYGETGTPMIANINNWPYGEAVSRAHWQLVGETVAADPFCYGAIGFSLTDFDANNFGVFSEAFVGPKGYIEEPLARYWPNVG